MKTLRYEIFYVLNFHFLSAGESDIITPPKPSRRARSTASPPSLENGADDGSMPFWATFETVDVLRQICRANGLETTGRKMELVARIKKRYAYMHSIVILFSVGSPSKVKLESRPHVFPTPV
jgi:hypothetical protein